ncbi:MAG: septum formation initiator family protein [Clostridium sp.]|uniref:septum formation initiator family protein n=1 Tax=Clostridium sp. TaxID=1506 RepID=UPI003EE620CB
MIEREFKYINGNTAVKPERKVKRNEKELNYEKYLKAKLKREALRKKEKAKKGLAIIQVAMVTLGLGLITIYRNAEIYSMQKGMGEVKKEINILNSENEAIKVELLKNSSLKRIEENAKKKVNMIEASEGTKVNIDLTTNHLGELMNNK